MKVFMFAGAALAALAPIPALAQPAPPPPPAAVAPPAPPPPMRRADVEQQLRDQFTRLDANHDGTLSREEAAADAGQRRGGPGGAGGPGRGTDAFFDRLDTNHDNMLSREEFVAMRTMFRGGGGGGGFMALNGDWFDRVDANKDGKVTLDEMRTVVLGLFDRADANHDGIVTADEREAMMRAAMRARQEQRPPADSE